tara:strand:- start:1105 stop:1527 length:423 start_codon:yes stop_codon:yes gene_type:complete
MKRSLKAAAKMLKLITEERDEERASRDVEQRKTGDHWSCTPRKQDDNEDDPQAAAQAVKADQLGEVDKELYTADVVNHIKKNLSKIERRIDDGALDVVELEAVEAVLTYLSNSLNGSYQARERLERLASELGFPPSPSYR